MPLSNDPSPAAADPGAEEGPEVRPEDPAADPAAGTPRRPIRSFVRRGGRMGTGQERALRELGPRFVLPFVPGRVLDLDVAFGRAAPRIVEIGFGMGQATAQIAAEHPDTDFLGVEVHEAGVGSLLRLVGERGLTNLRVVQHDAVEVLRDGLAPQSLAGVHIYFPDPWHKLRHHKRRLIQPPFVQLLASRLTPGGRLHLATDWQPYAQQMLEVLTAEATLVNSAPDGGFSPRPGMRPTTRFEQRGLRLGHGVWDLIFFRRAQG